MACRHRTATGRIENKPPRSQSFRSPRDKSRSGTDNQAHSLAAFNNGQQSEIEGWPLNTCEWRRLQLDWGLRLPREQALVVQAIHSNGARMNTKIHQQRHELGWHAIDADGIARTRKAVCENGDAVPVARHQVGRHETDGARTQHSDVSPLHVRTGAPSAQIEGPQWDRKRQESPASPRPRQPHEAQQGPALRRAPHSRLTPR